MNRRMEVSNWAPPSAPLEKGRSTLRLGFKLSPTAAGFIGTLLVHFLVLPAAILGFQAHKVHTPVTQGAGATNLNTGVSPSETLILFDAPPPPKDVRLSMEDLAPLGQAPKNLMMTVISADPLPRVDIPGPGQDQSLSVPCGEAGSSCYSTVDGAVPKDYWYKNLFGFNSQGGSCFDQSAACSAFFDKVPGLNAVALLHDNWMIRISGTTFANFATMLPAAALTYSAFVGEYYVPLLNMRH